MAKRKKSSRTPKPQKKAQALPTSFDCLFCNHEGSVHVVLDKTKQGIGKLQCSTCRVDFATQINYLYKPVDVYYAWLDQVQSEEAARTKPAQTPKPRTSVSAPAANEGPRRNTRAPDSDDDNEDIPPFEYPVDEAGGQRSDGDGEDNEDADEDVVGRTKKQRVAADTGGDLEREEAVQRHTDEEDFDERPMKRRHSEIAFGNEDGDGHDHQASGKQRQSGDATRTDKDRTGSGTVNVNDRGFFTESEEEPDTKVALPHGSDYYD